MTNAGQQILLVTGRLAEPTAERVAEQLRSQLGLGCRVHTLGISVAALMHVDWVARKLELPDNVDRVILPGWCQGELQLLQDKFQVPFERGPKELLDLPAYLTGAERTPPPMEAYSVEILAEINHAPQLDERSLLQAAERYWETGADIIDVGCIPGQRWAQTGQAVKRLVREGFRVSIDSFDQSEVEMAVEAGAELVLSCNSTNRDWVSRLGVEVVVIPDFQSSWESMESSLEQLDKHGCRYRVDPVLEPIGFGFGASLHRYYEVHQRWPAAEIMMGVGNLTELTDVDSAGVNMLLIALCQEWGVGSVLTTEVINWCRSSVAELAYARRVMHYCVNSGVLPKRLGEQLVRLRDPRLTELGQAALTELAARVKDPNFRIYAERGEIHVFNRDGFWTSADPFELFEQLAAESPVDDPSHAFYLGYEFAKAAIANALGKQYRQDEPLRWGNLTVAESSLVDRLRHGRPS